ncbi:MAG TPA: tyrosine-protein phosphatase [Microthrixaceae bacterium]|nr:tyrosine-protein phosphatase [Microthrixaceae bacterium]
MSDQIDDIVEGSSSGASEPKLIDVPGVKNLRDVGGLKTSDGHRMSERRLFRSAQLGDDDPDTLAGLAALGLEAVFDLRTSHETVSLPDAVPPGVEVFHLDVLAGTSESVATGLEDLFDDPAGATEILRQGKVTDHYLHTYKELVSLDSARASYQSLFTQIADGKVSLFHCTAGKDRTGWAAASLQLLLNVPLESVTADYLASNGPAMELFGPILDSFAAVGGDPKLLAPVFQVDAEYLSSALSEVTELFGDIEGYFHEGLGLDREVTEAIRHHLLIEG